MPFFMASLISTMQCSLSRTRVDELAAELVGASLLVLRLEYLVDLVDRLGRVRVRAAAAVRGLAVLAHAKLKVVV